MKREPKVHSEKFYRKRSKVLRGAGLTTIGLTTTGGFFAYQSIIDWNNFQKRFNEFRGCQSRKCQIEPFYCSSIHDWYDCFPFCHA